MKGIVPRGRIPFSTESFCGNHLQIAGEIWYTLRVAKITYMVILAGA